MPDTKSGRERKGRNKRRQLEAELATREVSLDEEAEPPTPEEPDSEFLAPPEEGNVAADDD